VTLPFWCSNPLSAYREWAGASSDGSRISGGRGYTGAGAFLFEEGGVPVALASLAQMAHTVAAGIYEAVVDWERGVIETDPDALGRAANPLNPSSPCWRDFARSR
jgi:hypothetical protein